MPTPLFSEALALSTLEAIHLHGSVREAATALDIKRQTMQSRAQRAQAILPDWQPGTRLIGIGEAEIRKRLIGAALAGKIAGPPIPELGQPPEGFAVFRNSAEYSADGELSKQWVGTRRAPGEVYTVPAGHVVKGESTLLDADGRTLARWVKTRESSGDALIDALRVAFAEHDGKAEIIPAPMVSDVDLLTVYPVPDLHLGMRAWGEETGADYDVRIAVATASASVASLVDQSRPSADAVVMILGDFFHQNDSKNVTPGSGHQLDIDGRWPAVFLAGAKLAIALVETVARKHERVELVIRPGNHDADAAVTLSVALGLYYSENERITVNMTPGVTWYRRFGSVLLGGHHGHTMKAERAAMAMAADMAQDWGLTTHRHIFSGHLHHEVAHEAGGVRIETLSSPAARDAWNSASGYRANRALSAVTFHKERGEIGRHRVHIP